MKILKNKKMSKICLSLMLMISLILGCMGNQYGAETQIVQQTTNETKQINVKYNTHIQNIGWENDFSKKDGEMSGTTGQSLRLEGIKIKLENAEKISIKYQTHIQNIGWQDWKKDGEMAGTTGQSLRLEGIKIKLENTEKYSVMYRVHVQNIGWQDWKYDGEMAGTEGQSLRLEAIEIKIVKKNTKFLLNIDTTLQNVTFDCQKLHIEGWKLATEPNTKLEVYIDEKEIDEKYIKYSYKYALTSIVKGYGTAKDNPTPNFDIDIPLNILDNGKHKIKIKFIASDNTLLKEIENDIITNNNFFRIHIESIFNGNTITSETHSLSGWLMTSVKDPIIKLTIDGQYQENEFKRTQRQDVLNYFNNIYLEENPTPGFSTDIDFSKLSKGQHQIALNVFDENDTKIGEQVINIFLRKKITYEEGIYGKSAYAEIGDSRGSDLKYYRYGDGPNVFFATFSVHGFEDNWDNDGAELTYIANKFYETLKNSHSENYNLANKWTIYILPMVNPDGQKYGHTSDGPGRTTMYSLAPNNKGIDLNRCWKYSEFNADEKSRNYAGTEPFQAYEAQYLRDFLQKHKSQKGQTILVDLHGWLQQLVGDREVGMYYAVQFPENNGYALDRYGDGYLINWARTALASNGRLAKTALIELPDGSYNHQSVVDRKFAERYIQATLSMLNGII